MSSPTVPRRRGERCMLYRYGAGCERPGGFTHSFQSERPSAGSPGTRASNSVDLALQAVRRLRHVAYAVNRRLRRNSCHARLASSHLTHTRLMRRLMQSTAVLVTLSLFAIACGKDTSEPSARGMCTGGVKLHVTAGLTPDISWTPDCKLFMVGVELASTGDDRWFVASTDISTAGGLSSPIHYGVLPPGAVLVDGPVPLPARRREQRAGLSPSRGESRHRQPDTRGSLGFHPVRAR